MKYVAEMFHASTGWNGTDFSGPVLLIPMCGSDAICPLDGRLGRAKQIAAARLYIKRLRAVKPHILGFRVGLWRGLDPIEPLTGVLPVEPGTVLPYPAAPEYRQ